MAGGGGEGDGLLDYCRNCSLSNITICLILREAICRFQNIDAHLPALTALFSAFEDGLFVFAKRNEVMFEKNLILLRMRSIR